MLYINTDKHFFKTRPLIAASFQRTYNEVSKRSLVEFRPRLKECGFEPCKVNKKLIVKWWRNSPSFKLYHVMNKDTTCSFAIVCMQVAKLSFTAFCLISIHKCRSSN